MGLGNNAGNAIFLSISNGKVCRQLSAPSKTSTERVNKKGKTVHEEYYDHVSGVITDITVREHPEFGKDWNVIIQDGTERYNLQFKYSSGYASGFLKTLPNADVTKKITFIPNLKEEGDKKRTTLFLSQDGSALKHYYTKDNPNALPQMVQVKVKGVMVWDDSAMMEFLENMVNNQIKPKLVSGATTDPGDEHPEEEDAQFATAGPEDQKAPF